jgi:Mn2+/Fe2+ NRAMP family transporter
MKKLYTKIQVLIAPMLVWALALPALAQPDPTGIRDEARTRTSFEVDDLIDLVQRILNIVLIFVGLVAVAFLLVGAIQYITSQGDSEKAKTARSTIVYSLIGVAVAVLAFAVVNFVASILS